MTDKSTNIPSRDWSIVLSYALAGAEDSVSEFGAVRAATLNAQSFMACGYDYQVRRS